MAETGTRSCSDPVILNQWHAVADLNEIRRGPLRTLLLGAPLTCWIDDDGTARARTESGGELEVRTDYGYLWTTLGEPDGGVFAVPETYEDDRRTLNALTVGIQVSAPRAVENFLDMAHFPYVHAGVLGEEPHTEVAEYRVEERDGELWAVDCVFYQPRAAAASSQAVLAEYIYRVPHPYSAMLYKSSPSDADRMDAIGIFIHPLTDTRIRAHLFLSVLDQVSADQQIRRFQQEVIAQDKPILENQHPKLLPLDPRAETPIRADRSAIAYRRWLSRLGVTYGVIPALEAERVGGESGALWQR
ncbi:MAG: aromatic ring-hydroxylating dioxygenase subunit alpha [Acidimicrobiia bacterium]|nr:aromatic ring-hydroxylating dioxygenase subunit alpha [Acidimicrobiia bacterium]